MIKVSFSEIESIISSLKVLASKELPYKISYAFKKLMKQLYSEYEIYQEERNQIIDKYAERDEQGNIKQNGNIINLKSNCVELAQSKLRELNSVEFEVDFSPISIESLGEITISPKDLFNLDKFIID